jgi:hypothetical protein
MRQVDQGTASPARRRPDRRRRWRRWTRAEVVRNRIARQPAGSLLECVVQLTAAPMLALSAEQRVVARRLQDRVVERAVGHRPASVASVWRRRSASAVAHRLDVSLSRRSAA